MLIHNLDFVEGAKSARGLTVIIDVFRAFSTSCYCIQQGATSIHPATTVEDAQEKAAHLGNTILIGEREGKKVNGFAMGNSPTDVIKTDFSGKNVVLTTHAGTQGLLNTPGAHGVVTGALVNARATAEYIKQQSPSEVSLVRMGWKAEELTDEDRVCSEYLAALLTGQDYDEAEIEKQLRASPYSQRFFDPSGLPKTRSSRP